MGRKELSGKEEMVREEGLKRVSKTLPYRDLLQMRVAGMAKGCGCFGCCCLAMAFSAPAAHFRRRWRPLWMACRDLAIAATADGPFQHPTKKANKGREADSVTSLPRAC